MAAELYQLVIRAADIEQAKQIYEAVGLVFTREQHGSGPEHFASELNGIVFEIYPEKPGQEPSHSLRLGFRVESVDQVLESLVKFNVEIVMQPHDSSFGRRAVIRDPDGHTIEIGSTK